MLPILAPAREDMVTPGLKGSGAGVGGPRRARLRIGAVDPVQTPDGADAGDSVRAGLRVGGDAPTDALAGAGGELPGRAKLTGGEPVLYYSVCHYII